MICFWENIYSIKIKEITNLSKFEYLYSLNSPYREAFSQRQGDWISRVALPDLDK